MTEHNRSYEQPVDPKREGFDLWWAEFSVNSAMAQKGVRMDAHTEIAAWQAWCEAWSLTAEAAKGYRQGYEDGLAAAEYKGT
jgi:hypothetical protein